LFRSFAPRETQARQQCGTSLRVHRATSSDDAATIAPAIIARHSRAAGRESPDKASLVELVFSWSAVLVVFTRQAAPFDLQMRPRVRRVVLGIGDDRFRRSIFDARRSPCPDIRVYDQLLIPRLLLSPSPSPPAPAFPRPPPGDLDKAELNPTIRYLGGVVGFLRMEVNPEEGGSIEFSFRSSFFLAGFLQLFTVFLSLSLSLSLSYFLSLSLLFARSRSRSLAS